MPRTITFFVPGTPVPGGSKKSFVNPKTKRIVTLDDAKGNKPWRDRVASFGLEARGAGEPLLTGPLAVSFEFVMARPRGHFGTGRNASVVRPAAPRHPTVKPDVLKLARAAEDALTGVLYHDDNATVCLTASKEYGPRPGVTITITPLD